MGGIRRGFESIGGQCVFTSEMEQTCGTHPQSQPLSRFGDVSF
ncbi:hypothetical protein ACLK1S_12270 [Escherichia coli]